MDIQKYDIVLVDLNPKKGSAQAGVRPCVVLQSNAFNPHATTIIVCPLTSNKRKIFPSEFLITPSKTNGLTEESRFLGSQILTIDKAFCTKKLGQLENEYYAHVAEAVSVALDFEDMF